MKIVNKDMIAMAILHRKTIIDGCRCAGCKVDWSDCDIPKRHENTLAFIMKNNKVKGIVTDKSFSEISLKNKNVIGCQNIDERYSCLTFKQIIEELERTEKLFLPGWIDSWQQKIAILKGGKQ
jgi:hypothetical protein